MKHSHLHNLTDAELVRAAQARLREHDLSGHALWEEVTSRFEQLLGEVAEIEALEIEAFEIEALENKVSALEDEVSAYEN